ncbi:MAG: AAA family ATPase [Gemmatales bacterium]
MERIESLSIKNFRGIRQGAVEGLADVNVFVGRNNSGKTTIIEAITRLAQHFGLGGDLLGRDMNNFWQNTRRRSGEHLRYMQARDEALEVNVTIEKVVHRLTIQPNGNTIIDPQHSQGKREFLSKMFVLAPQDAFDHTIESRFWHTLLANRRDKYLTTTLNTVFNLKAETFQMLPDGKLMVLFSEYSIPLDLQGDGTRTALRTMMILAMLKRTLLMLEEPECYQHPGSLERFALALCKLARQQEVQLIISTHSGECVRAFLKGAKEAESEAALFHLKLEDGIQEARRLDPEAIETLNSTGVDVRFLDLYA